MPLFIGKENMKESLDEIDEYDSNLTAKDINDISLAKFYDIDCIALPNVENSENIGLTYFNLGDYTNAEIYLRMVSQAMVYANGKSEFFLGVSLLQLGRKDEACHFLNKAAIRNYPQAKELFNSNNCQIKN